MKNLRKLNNKGLSMVEMIISVTILSIIMAGMAAILSSMSRNFSISQTEIALQDNVQSTYSVVANLIQEAQTETAKTTEKVVETSGNKVIITANDTQNKANSKYYVVELDPDDNKLYIDQGNLYTQSGIDTFTKNTIPSTIIDSEKDSKILATDVTAFSVDDSKYEEGYVVLGLRCEKRGRKASITQNVYLRNSNKSAEEGSTKVKEMESDIPDNYHVKEVESITHNDSFTYSDGAAVAVTDFKLVATYVSDDDPTQVLLHKDVPKTDITYICKDLSDDGSYISIPGSDKIVTTFSGDKMNIVFLLNDDHGQYYVPKGAKAVISKKSGNSFTNKDTSSAGGITNPSGNSASTNANVEVSFSANTTSTTTQSITTTTTYTSDVRVCKGCGASVKYDPSDWRIYVCNHATPYDGTENACCKGDPDGNKWSCSGKISSSYMEEHKAGDTVTATANYVTGTGVITIQNIGTTDIKNISVTVYVDGNGIFVKKGGAFLTFKKATSSGISTEYRTDVPTTANAAKYIKIDISKLSANATDSRKSDTIKINFNWGIPKADYDNGKRPQIAVFSETHS